MSVSFYTWLVGLSCEFLNPTSLSWVNRNPSTWPMHALLVDNVLPIKVIINTLPRNFTKCNSYDYRIFQAYLENYKFECRIDCHAPKPEYLNPFQILLRYNNFALSITYLFLWTRILISPIHIMYNNSWLIRSWLVKETKSVFLHTFLNLLNEVIPAAPYYIIETFFLAFIKVPCLANHFELRINVRISFKSTLLFYSALTTTSWIS